MKYGASGIPHLVVVDNTPNRKVITSDGVGEVQLDPEGKNFPWRPKSFKEVWPSKYLTKNGLVDSTTLENKHLMLYFSAHWCPPVSIIAGRFYRCSSFFLPLCLQNTCLFFFCEAQLNILSHASDVPIFCCIPHLPVQEIYPDSVRIL